MVPITMYVSFYCTSFIFLFFKYILKLKLKIKKNIQILKITLHTSIKYYK